MRRVLSLVPFLDLPPLVNMVRLAGLIGGGGRFAPGLTDAALAPAIERAFSRGRPKAVALIVNSPGGSAVQASLIAARIRRLAEEKGVRVHAFVEDVAASGGYWLATAADDIWVDATSLVGSIGVIYAGFGLHGLMQKAGLERRVHTAGRAKSLLDPFLPEKAEDVARLRALIEPIHARFIAEVQARRGARLADHPDLFTGEVFGGARAVELGLADGVAHPVPKLRELYGAKVVLASVTPPRGLFGRLGGGLAAEVIAALEERAAYARLGL